MRFSRSAASFGWSFLSVVCVTLVASSALRAQSETGVWGDPGRLRVEGVEQLDARHILAALSTDPELAWDSHPRAPLPKYVESLRHRATWGVQHAGFPKARVSVRQDRDAKELIVDIIEGKRYRAGVVRVTGCPDDLARQLEQWVKDPAPPETAFLKFLERPDGTPAKQWMQATGKVADLQAALWDVKGFAPFDEPTLQAIRKHVARGLANEGWDEARLTVNIARDESTGVANLDIQIADLGTLARISELTVVGAERNRPQDFFDFLKLAVGQPFAADRSAECDSRLMTSARFRHHKIESRRKIGGEGIHVTITVEEYAHAPRLLEPFSREEQALLRSREWLMKYQERGEELVLRREKSSEKDTTIEEVVIGGDRGMLLRVGRSAGRKLSICLGQNEWGFYLSDRGGALGVPQTMREQMRGTMHITLADPSTEKHSFKSVLGVGIHSIGTGERRAPFVFDLWIEPVSILAMAHEDAPKFSWQGDELSMSTDKMRCKIDAKTGRILDMVHVFESGSTWRTTCEKNYFDRRLAEIRREAGPSVYDAERPATSIANFAASEPMTEFVLSMFDPDAEKTERVVNQWSSTAALVRQLAGVNSLKVFDDVLRELYRNQIVEQGKFVLPMPEAEVKSANLARIIGGWGLRLVDGAFVRDSWPSSLSRATICFYAQEFQFIDFELRRLDASPKFGPLGHLATSYTFPHPQAQKAFALRGLDKLTMDGFHGDRDELLANLERLNCVRPLVSLLRHLSPDEARALGTSLLADGDAMVELSQRLRDARDDEAALETLPAVLDQLWERTLRDRVKAMLRERASLETAERPGLAPR